MGNNQIMSATRGGAAMGQHPARCVCLALCTVVLLSAQLVSTLLPLSMVLVADDVVVVLQL